MRIHTDDGYHAIGYLDARAINPHPSGYSITTIQIEEGCLSPGTARWLGPERYLTWHIIGAHSTQPHVRERYEQGWGDAWQPGVGHDISGMSGLCTAQYHTDELFPCAGGMTFRGHRRPGDTVVWYRLMNTGLEYLWECDAVRNRGPGPLEIRG